MEIQLEPEFWQSSHNNQIGEFSCWRCTLHQDTAGSSKPNRRPSYSARLQRWSKLIEIWWLGNFNISTKLKYARGFLCKIWKVNSLSNSNKNFLLSILIFSASKFQDLSFTNCWSWSQTVWSEGSQSKRRLGQVIGTPISNTNPPSRLLMQISCLVLSVFYNAQ